ncbi:MAG: hypothetical protein JO200_01775 [Comamonas sp.]|nr:hypothetical protein [Comamonas sp.]
MKLRHAVFAGPGRSGLYGLEFKRFSRGLAPRGAVAGGVVCTGLHACLLLGMMALAAPARAELRFVCSPAQLPMLEKQMVEYLGKLDIDPALVTKSAQQDTGVVAYALATPENDTDTLDLFRRAEYKLPLESVQLPVRDGKLRKVVTVSKKEILLSMLQHGRMTSFDDAACSLGALEDHIGVRQNIVAWTEVLQWTWPDGGRARWNQSYWANGIPRNGVSMAAALMDAFQSQSKYAIGCYTAAKLLMAQGVVDYFQRVRPDASRELGVERRLALDGDPLVDVEPPRMWSFEKEFDPATLPRPGKLLRIAERVAPRNFIPGDWAYFVNTDPRSSQKTGYEGSNAIYLGRGKFGDFYNDNHHAYTFDQKLDEVYQWRNGVFSRSRDFKKIQKISAQDYERLARTPEEGGLVLDIRATPHLFGYETLPPLGTR